MPIPSISNPFPKLGLSAILVFAALAAPVEAEMANGELNGDIYSTGPGCDRPRGSIGIQISDGDNTWSCDTCAGHVVVQVGLGKNTVDCNDGNCLGNVAVQVGVDGNAGFCTLAGVVSLLEGAGFTGSAMSASGCGPQSPWGSPQLCCPRPIGPVGDLLFAGCGAVNLEVENAWIFVWYYPPGVYAVTCNVLEYCPCYPVSCEVASAVEGPEASAAEEPALASSVPCSAGDAAFVCWTTGLVMCRIIPMSCPGEFPCPPSTPHGNWYCGLYERSARALLQEGPTAGLSGADPFSVPLQDSALSCSPDPWGSPALCCQFAGGPPVLNDLEAAACAIASTYIQTVWIFVWYYPPGVYAVVCNATGYCPCYPVSCVQALATDLSGAAIPSTPGFGTAQAGSAADPCDVPVNGDTCWVSNEVMCVVLGISGFCNYYGCPPSLPRDNYWCGLWGEAKKLIPRLAELQAD